MHAIYETHRLCPIINPGKPEAPFILVHMARWFQEPQYKNCFLKNKKQKGEEDGYHAIQIIPGTA